jgi:protein-L-histidine (3S)-3-hydroxylase / [histone H3]-trimethyl-L-lysine4/36 demethylase
MGGNRKRKRRGAVMSRRARAAAGKSSSATASVSKRANTTSAAAAAAAASSSDDEHGASASKKVRFDASVEEPDHSSEEAKLLEKLHQHHHHQHIKLPSTSASASAPDDSDGGSDDSHEFHSAIPGINFVDEEDEIGPLGGEQPWTFASASFEAELYDYEGETIADAKASYTGHQIIESPDLGGLEEHERPLALFAWMIAPMTVEQFYEEYWQKKPLLIRRNPIHATLDAGQSDSKVSKKSKKGRRSKKTSRSTSSSSATSTDKTPSNAHTSIHRQLAGCVDAFNFGAGSKYYDGWYHRTDLDECINNHEFVYGRDLNVTKYENGVRHTLDPEKRVTVSDINDFLADGCSVRVLCPQKHLKPMWRMLSLVEEHWGSGAGSNVYLTPASHQGFAPHYDDIEAFILQSEGAKHWRVYLPRNEAEYLDRFSSPNYDQDEIGVPILETTLHTGDFLYFPRGFIHQAVSHPSLHSLHVTVSTGLKNTWLDMMESLLPRVIQLASNQNSTFRQLLPRDYMSYMGVVHQGTAEDLRTVAQAANQIMANREEDDDINPAEDGELLMLQTAVATLADKHNQRQSFIDNFSELMQELTEVGCTMLDGGADEMATKFIHERLPVPLSGKQRKSMVRGSKKVAQDSYIRLLRRGIACLRVEEVDDMEDEVADAADESGAKATAAAAVAAAAGVTTAAGTADDDAPMDEDEDKRFAVLYHCMSNSRVYHDKGPQSLVFSLEYAPAIEAIISAYPESIKVAELPLDTKAERLDLAKLLLQEQIIMIADENGADK